MDADFGPDGPRVAPRPRPTLVAVPDAGASLPSRRCIAFRSADLARLEPDAAQAALAQLGIRTVYDLRTTPERRATPERGKLPGGSRYVVVDVMRDSPGGSPAHYFRLMADPQLAAADVPEEQVRADYMASNDALRGSMDAALDRFVAVAGDRTWLEPLTQVRPTYLDMALGEVSRAYGSIPGYFALGLGIDEAGQRRLQDAFVEPG